MNETDLQLLSRYAHERAEDAFAELVQRHLGLVYSAALRQVQSPELAQEVSQSVFLDLARNAADLPPETVLPAWLFQVARRTAIDIVRRETRRQNREKIACQLADMNSSSADWSEIEPLLDEAVQSLDHDDRAAVVLRYFSGKSLREVGETLGASENAAQKRLTRAVDRLSEFFARRGVRISSTALIASLSAHSAQAVPVGLGIAITAAVTQTATTAATAAATGILTMNALKTAAIAAAIVAAVGTGLYQSHRAFALRSELEKAKAHTLPAEVDVDQLARERDEAVRKLAALQSESQRPGATNPELMRLRDEVSRLRREAQETAAAKNANASTEAAAAGWLNRLTQLKTRLSLTPEAQIPELQFLTQEDWLAAVKQPNLETDEYYRKAFADLRNAAQSRCAAQLRPALARHLKANNGVFPTDLSELQAFFETGPLDPAILNRYAIRPASEIPNVKMGGDWAITQKAPIDSQYDLRVVIGPNGYGSSSYPRETDLTDADHKALAQATKAYSAANNGREPLDPAQVEPYLTTPEAKAAYAKFLKSQAAKPNSGNSTVSR